MAPRAMPVSMFPFRASTVMAVVSVRVNDVLSEKTMFPPTMRTEPTSLMARP